MLVRDEAICNESGQKGDNEHAVHTRMSQESTSVAEGVSLSENRLECVAYES